MAKRRRPGARPANRPRAEAPQSPPPRAGASLPRSPLPWLLGITLFVLPLILNLWITDEYETPKLVFLRVFVAAIVGAGLFSAWRSGVASGFLRRAAAPLLFIAAFTLSTLFSVSPWTSFLGEYGSLAGVQSQLCYVAVCVAALMLSSAREVRLVVTFAVAGAVLSTGMALTEAAGHEIGTFFGLSAEIAAHTTSGTFGNANYFAGYTVSIIPVAVYLARAGHPALRLVAGLVAAASSVAVLMSGSRTGIMCLAGLAVWLPLFLAHPYLLARRARRDSGADDAPATAPPAIAALLRRQARLILPIAVAALALGAYFALPQIKRVGRGLAKPMAALSADRLHLWSPALAITKEHPLLGAGPDTYAMMAPRHFDPRVYRRLGAHVTARRAHSEPLNMLACTGAVGLIAWLWLFGSALWRGLRRSRGLGEGTVDPGLSLALTTALGAGLAFNCLHFITVGQAPWLFALAGLLLGPAATAQEAEKSRRPPGVLVGIGMAASALLAVAVIVDGKSWIAADKHLKGSVVANLSNKPEVALAEAVAAAEERGIERRYLEASAQLHLRAAASKRTAPEKSAHLEQARAAIVRALAIGRAPLTLWVALSIEQRAGDVMSAALLAREAMDRDPTRPRMLRSLVDWFFSRGRAQDASAIFALAFRNDPSGAAALALEVAEAVAGNRSAAAKPEVVGLARELAERAAVVDGYAERAQRVLVKLPSGD